MYLVITIEQGVINTDFTKVFEDIDKACDYLIEVAKEHDIPIPDKEMNIHEIELRIREELDFSGQQIELHPIQKG